MVVIFFKILVFNYFLNLNLIRVSQRASCGARPEASPRALSPGSRRRGQYFLKKIVVRLWGRRDSFIESLVSLLSVKVFLILVHLWGPLVSFVESLRSGLSTKGSFF
jgi:hypothetical protein